MHITNKPYLGKPFADVSYAFKVKFFFSKTENFTSPLCVQRLSRYFNAYKNMNVARFPAIMDEIQKFICELFRINDNNYDAKY